MGKITAYFSHTIRGKKGISATSEDMNTNCAKARKVADWIRENVPDLELYVPAEHEDFVQIAYLQKYLTEKQILDVDCEILRRQDFLIVLEEDGWRGGGIAVEIDAAIAADLCVFTVNDMNDTTILRLKQLIKEILEMKEKNAVQSKIDYTVVDVALTEKYREGLIDIAWRTKSAAFGHLSFGNGEDGKIYCSSETMSREIVKQVLNKLVDVAIFEE